MKKWSYLLAASVLSGVLFASSPAAVFAGGTGGSSGSGTVSTEQAAGSQTGGNSSGTDENAAAGTNGAESSGAEGSSGTAGGNGTVSGNDAAGENGAAGGNGTAGENDAAGGAAEAQEPYMGYIRGTEGYPTDVPDSSWQKIGTEPENTDAYAVKTVEDGTYVITMASNGFKALDSSSSGGTVRLGDADGGSVSPGMTAKTITRSRVTTALIWRPRTAIRCCIQTSANPLQRKGGTSYRTVRAITM